MYEFHRVVPNVLVYIFQTLVYEIGSIRHKSMFSHVNNNYVIIDYLIVSYTIKITKRDSFVGDE